MKMAIGYLFKLIGLGFSYFLPNKIKILLGGIPRYISTGYKSRFLKHVGRDTLFAPSVSFFGEKYISIGVNSSIGARGRITAWEDETYTPEILIGDRVQIGDDCHITAINKIHIGNDVLLGKKVTITDNSHGKTDLDTLLSPPLKRKIVSKGTVIIKDNVWIGDKATILSNVTIGKNAIIGTNTVVTASVPDNSIAVGSPMRIVNNYEGGVAVMVLYFPNISDVLNNIRQYISDVDKLILWDNTPREENWGRIELPDNKDKLLYLSTGRNEGTAYAYNRAAEWAFGNGYSYLLLMDQDGTWKGFPKYIQESVSIMRQNRAIIVSPPINKDAENTIEIDNCISSGMLISYLVYYLLGPFDEGLNVDAVDMDYCLRARDKDIKIIKLGDVVLYQRFGNLSYSKLFHCYTRNDSPMRCYNIAKNHLLLLKKYPKLIKKQEMRNWLRDYIYIKMLKILLIEKDKWSKCSAIIRAVCDATKQSND
jgi:acetyltransferase-like isoleucine patch superfamily enzyme/GT2 family glycosyltransferase